VEDKCPFGDLLPALDRCFSCMQDAVDMPSRPHLHVVLPELRTCCKSDTRNLSLTSDAEYLSSVTTQTVASQLHFTIVCCDRSDRGSCICPAQAAECDTTFGDKNRDWGYGLHTCLAFDGQTMADLVAKAASMAWCGFYCAQSGNLARWLGPNLASIHT